MTGCHRKIDLFTVCTRIDRINKLLKSAYTTAPCFYNILHITTKDSMTREGNLVLHRTRYIRNYCKKCLDAWMMNTINKNMIIFSGCVVITPRKIHVPRTGSHNCAVTRFVSSQLFHTAYITMIRHMQVIECNENTTRKICVVSSAKISTSLSLSV